MRDTVLKSLRKHLRYNDIVLGRIADDIVVDINDKFCVRARGQPKRRCYNCIHFQTLITTYIGKSPNLCQRGHEKTAFAAETCNDYFYAKNIAQEIQNDRMGYFKDG